MSQRNDNLDSLPDDWQQTIGELHRDLFPKLVRLAWAILRDGELANDAAQEAFTLLTQKIGTNPNAIAPENLAGWLVKTTQFTARNLKRKKQRHSSQTSQLPVDALATPGSIDELQASESLQELSKQVNDLPASQRRVLELRFVEGLTFQEIANQEDAALGTILSRFRLAIQKLKQRLRDE